MPAWRGLFRDKDGALVERCFVAEDPVAALREARRWAARSSRSETVGSLRLAAQTAPIDLLRIDPQPGPWPVRIRTYPLVGNPAR